MIPRDNDTRWGSWEAQIRVFLDPKVKAAYIKWIERFPLTSPAEDRLTEADWKQSEKVYEFLKAIVDVTSMVEGTNATLDRVLPSMEFILDHFEKGKVYILYLFFVLITHLNQVKFADDPYLGPCCSAGWRKIDKYYSLTDDSTAYMAAVVLDPSHKWIYFEENWVDFGPEVLKNARITLDKFYNQYYHHLENDIEPCSQEVISDNTYVAMQQSRKAAREKNPYAQSGLITVALPQSKTVQIPFNIGSPSERSLPPCLGGLLTFFRHPLPLATSSDSSLVVPLL